VRNATKYEYDRMNDYFKDSGRQFDESDKILVFEDILDVGRYLFEHDPYKLLSILSSKIPDNLDETLLETVINDELNVWIDYENGTFFVIPIY
jgi:hypothetical protein